MMWRTRAGVLGVAGMIVLGAVACQEQEEARSEKVTPAAELAAQPEGEQAAQPGSDQAAQPTGELPEGHPPMAGQGAAPAGARGGSLEGEVLETMDAGGYTYAKLETGDGAVWVAVQQTSVAVGDRMGVAGANLMKGFRSKTLDRTFDEIYFGTRAGEGAAAGKGAPTGGAGAVAAPSVEPVAKAEGEGAYTVAELFAKSGDLSGEPVVVRGKVVKFNAGIMGKNWVHLQDGTGSAGQNDITLTTQASVRVGDVVTMTGTLVTDKDFGAGYQYDVIIEEAQLRR